MKFDKEIDETWIYWMSFKTENSEFHFRVIQILNCQDFNTYQARVDIYEGTSLVL